MKYLLMKLLTLLLIMLVINIFLFYKLISKFIIIIINNFFCIKINYYLRSFIWCNYLYVRRYIKVFKQKKKYY